MQLSDGLIKTIIAFANGSGGTAYVGVDDYQNVIGVDDIDAELLKLTSMMKDRIHPGILMHVKTTVERHGDKDIIVVAVQKGSHCPYYLKAKGMRPEGVYVRSGSASVPSSDTAIRQMVQETSGLSFEQFPSPTQDLSFDYAEKVFAERGLSLGDAEMRTLGLVEDGAFTYLGRIVSDQCPQFIKAASFADDRRDTFLERQEFSGSILKQLEDAYAFLKAHNHFKTSYEGLRRMDYLDYPEIALREAVVNAVAHRDYALSGPTLVSVMPSCVEIVSLGGLVHGIVFEDLEANISMPRNRRFAALLYRLGIIEAWGTGIGRMRASYGSNRRAVDLSVTPNTFTVVLSNRNGEDANENDLSSVENAVVEAIREGADTRRRIQEAIGLSQTKTLSILEALVARGIVVREGNTRSIRYSLTA